jgi:restriction endonuclease S subunit
LTNSTTVLTGATTPPNVHQACFRGWRSCRNARIHSLLRSNPLNRFNKNPKQSGLPHLNGGLFDNLPMPLPPLSEQKLIVAEIEKQLAKMKQLKEHIIANQQATEQLLKALLHQAFEVRESEVV